MSKISVSINVEDLREIEKIKKKELENAVISNYPYSVDAILRSIHHGIYKGFFDMEHHDLKKKYDTSSVVQVMDVKLLNGYIACLDRMIYLVSQKVIDSSESGSCETFYDYALNAGKKERAIFSEKLRRKPKTYLDNVMSGRQSFDRRGKAEIVVRDDLELREEVKNAVATISSYIKTDRELDGLYEDLKNGINKLSAKKFINHRGFGSTTNKIYLGMFQMSAPDILDYLKNSECKSEGLSQKSVVGCMDAELKTYYLAVLGLCLRNLEDEKNTNESLLRIKFFRYGEQARRLYIKEHEVLPLDKLAEVNKEHRWSLGKPLPDVEQLSFIESYYPYVRRKKR